MVRVHYCAVMVTGMHFLKLYFYESQVDIKEKREKRINLN